MKLLLDTHAFLWWRTDDRRLGAAAALPPHHQDPFDRILIAQALAEGLTLVTRDQAIRRYEVPLLW